MKAAVALVGVSLLLSGCTSSPTTSTVPPAAPPVVSNAPASIQILASTRPDSQLDVVAKVLTAQNAFVPDATVTFSVNSGSVSPTTAVTDAGGLARTIVTSTGKVTIHAEVGSIASSVETNGTVTGLSVSLFVAAVTTGTASTLTANVSGLAPGSTAIGFAWTFGDTTSASTAAPSTTHPYARGTYPASVTVTDSLGRSATASASAVVTDPPAPPAPPAPSYTVTVVAAPSALLIGASSTLTATVTQQNSAPAPTSFAWDCDGNGVAEVTNALTTHSCAYPVAGVIVSKVVVSGVGVTAVTGTANVTVTTAIPVVTVSCSTGIHLGAASTCVVSATLGGLVVPSGNITSVSWDFGDGVTTTNTAGNVSPAHTYGSANPFTVSASNVLVVGATGPGSGSTSTTILP